MTSEQLNNVLIHTCTRHARIVHTYIYGVSVPVEAIRSVQAAYINVKLAIFIVK